MSTGEPTSVLGHVQAEPTIPASRATSITLPSTDSPGSVSDLLTEYPHLAELAAHAAGSDFGVDQEFQHGVDLILDGLERDLASAPDLRR